MIIPTDNEWSRFHRIREDLSDVPMSEVGTRIDQLREGGETSTVLSLLELHFRLARQPGLRPGHRLANRYTIRRKIGEGGMGVVYQAVQELTQQEVALKVIHPSLVSSGLIKRFREEIRTLGKLQHDHIVRVFDADQDKDDAGEQQVLFYAMQLVEGSPLTRWVTEYQPTLESRLECFIQICEAVDYAHRRGVVHRDLKPDNILVDAQGRPAILDFGLAQLADVAFEIPKGHVTLDGETVLQVSGTPAFLSRERWEGRSGGVPADVFALGVLLHELLTGTRPWKVNQDAGVNDLRRAICGFSPDHLQQHRVLTRPIRSLLGSMLSPDQAARPESSAAVAGTLRTILRRRRLWRRARRTAPIWGGIAVATASVLLTQAFNARIKRQERESEYKLGTASQIARQHDRADTLDRVLALLPGPHLRHSQDEWRDVVLEALCNWNLHTLEAVSLPAGFDPQTGDQSGRRFFGRMPDRSWRLVTRTNNSWISTPFPGASDPIRARLNPALPQLAILRSNGVLQIWEYPRSPPVTLLPSAGPDSQFEFSPDGSRLAYSVILHESDDPSGRRSARIHVFDTADWQDEEMPVFRGEPADPGSVVPVWSSPIAGLAFSHDGHYLASWSEESMYVMIWDLNTSRLVQYIRHRGAVSAASWRPDPNLAELATLENDGHIRSWSLASDLTTMVYRDLEGYHGWGLTWPGFQGQLAWTFGEPAVMAIDEARQQLGLFVPDAETHGLELPMTGRGMGNIRWLAGGLFDPGDRQPRWAPLQLDPPLHRILRCEGLQTRHLTFHPESAVLAAADSTRIVLFSVRSGEQLTSLGMPLSGSITFDASDGDLWAYNKTSGPVRLHCSPREGTLAYQASPSTPRQHSVGQLAAAGGHIAVSQGTNIYVRLADGASDISETEADITVDAPPSQLSLSAAGDLVAAIWRNPVRAALWRLEGGSAWKQLLCVSNEPVVTDLADWNVGSPLTIAAARRCTVGERELNVSSHFPGSMWIAAGHRRPMLAWQLDSDRGIHLDFLGRQSCLHIGTLPLERSFGAETVMALSPDGFWLAAANADGAIHLWDLHRILGKLASFHLGIEEIDLADQEQRAQSRSSSKVADPD